MVAPNTQEESVKEEKSNTNLGVGGIIGIIIGVCIFVIGLVMVIINRNTISKKYKSTKTQVARNFQSYV